MKSNLLKPLAMPRALLALAMAGALLGTSTGALAAVGETSAGVTIGNLATLSYSVGGTSQASIGSSQGGNTVGAGTATNFVVDNKVNLLLTEVSTNATSVAPGALNKATGFLLTNTGNKVQGYTLTAANVSATVFSVADTFDVTSFSIYIDVNTDGLLDGGDTLITSIASLARDSSIRLLVVADIPAAQGNDTQAAVSLTAVAVTADTLVALTEAPNTQLGEENVFADAAITVANSNNTLPIQNGRDRTAIAHDAYRVAAAILSVFKTTAVVCDPFNGNGSPKNIPGAAVQYAITITNASTATASATLSQITDALDVANLNFDPGLISGITAGAACVAGTGNQSATGFGAVRGGGVATSYVAPGPGNTTQAVTAGATFASSTVTINFVTLAGTAYGAADPVLPVNSYITVYFNTFVK